MRGKADYVNDGDECQLFQNVKERVATFQGCKEYYAEVLDAYSSGLLAQSQARCIGYLLSGLLSFFKHEADLRIEQRIDALEDALEKRL